MKATPLPPFFVLLPGIIEALHHVLDVYPNVFILIAGISSSS
jgi:hypothetical protein